MISVGPKTGFSDELHKMKYRGGYENFRESMNRIAAVLKDSQGHYQQFRKMLLDMRFLPAGRIQLAIGSGRQVTALNCFASGTIHDTLVHGKGSIMDRAKEAAETMRMGGGIGYNFSTLRPHGSTIKKLDSVSSGPVSFMNIFNSICLTISSSGHRRGAQMGVMRIDHPDIREFVQAKQNEHALTGFNISVLVTDGFMEAVEIDEEFSLVFSGVEYTRTKARHLWEMIMRSTWDWAEPGVLFIDTINKMNNLRYCEEIETTNPCSEQPLPPYGACLLGSFNLVKYVDIENKKFVRDLFVQDVQCAVRAMDNVIDNCIFPLYEQEKEGKDKRRMGLGITGTANALEFLGHEYGSDGFVAELIVILEELRNVAYETSVNLAKEKGAFPALRKDAYLEAPFIKSLPKDIRDGIKKHGIRNSHLTSIAPTGTISLCADNVSSGIEPVFDYEYDRVLKTFEGDKRFEIMDYGKKFFGHAGKTSKDVTLSEHIKVLVNAQQYVDSSISKTLNVPSTTDWEEFKGVYHRVWKAGGKGCSTFTVGGKRMGVLTESQCSIDPHTGEKDCS